MPAPEQGQEQRPSQQRKGVRTAGVRRRLSATDPGIRDGPLPQVREATPAAQQGPNLMEEAECPKEDGDPKRLSWVEREPLPLPLLQEGKGAVQNRGDVIEAKIAHANGREVGKVMLEALEVEPAQEAGIFARVACTGVVDPELANYAVQILGMGKERKEFVVHLCASQKPGTCRETGAALHCGKWTVVPGGAGRGDDEESAETRVKTARGLRPEIEKAGPALFGSMDGERLGAQVAALADELGLDPPAKIDGTKDFHRAKKPSVGKRRFRCDPCAEKFQDQVGERKVSRVE